MDHIRITGLAAAMLLFFLIFPAVSSPAEEKVPLLFFWGEGCPHCARAKPFLEELQKRYPTLEIRSYEVLANEENLALLRKTAKRHGTEARGVPMFFLAGHFFSGFSEETARDIELEVRRATGRPAPGIPSPPLNETQVELPFFGTVGTSRLSLPVFTIVIAGLDSFNPCAFFVLFFLLSLLVHAHSRQRMLMIGGVFVLFSGLVYFLYMAAWLNFFLLFGSFGAITVIAGIVALVIAVLNIKDFFFFKRGISLVIPEQAKPKLFERMRSLVHAGSLPGALAATVILAVVANTYEVICTAGFPMVYTRNLTLQQLPVAVYYLYLLLYNAIYIVPLACIVLLFVVTLGSRKLSEWQGRILKLLSGTMMLGLALVLLIRPSLLNNSLVSLGLLLSAVAVTVILASAARLLGLHNEES